MTGTREEAPLDPERTVADVFERVGIDMILIGGDDE